MIEKETTTYIGRVVTRFCYVKVGGGSSLVLRNVTEEEGGSGRRLTGVTVTGE